jgi:hypothetical protein
MHAVRAEYSETSCSKAERRFTHYPAGTWTSGSDTCVLAANGGRLQPCRESFDDAMLGYVEFIAEDRDDQSTSGPDRTTHQLGRRANQREPQPRRSPSTRIGSNAPASMGSWITGLACRRTRSAVPGSAPSSHVRLNRMTTRGKPPATAVVSAAFVKPARSNMARVPTNAIVRSTFRPPLSTGYPSTAGASCDLA